MKIWLKLNSFVSHKTINRNTLQPASSCMWHVTEISTASAEEAQPPSIQENASISSECIVNVKAVQLQPDFLSLRVWKFFCNPSTIPSFLVKHVTITAKSCINYTRNYITQSLGCFLCATRHFNMSVITTIYSKDS